MKWLVAAVHSVITPDGDLVMDPNQTQCEEAQASLTFVYDSVDKNIVASYTTGKFTVGQYNDALEQCRDASEVVFKFYRDAVRKFTKCL